MVDLAYNYLSFVESLKQFFFKGINYAVLEVDVEYDAFSGMSSFLVVLEPPIVPW